MERRAWVTLISVWCLYWVGTVRRMGSYSLMVMDETLNLTWCVYFFIAGVVLLLLLTKVCGLAPTYIKPWLSVCWMKRWTDYCYCVASGSGVGA